MANYKQQAKDLLQQICGYVNGRRNSAIDIFVDCIIKAAVEEMKGELNHESSSKTND